jgi:MFS family permease
MTPSLLLALEALRLFGAGFFYFAHAALAALGALGALQASLALAFRLLAEPLFALYGGHLADRWPRERLLLLAALGQGGLTLALLPLLGAPSPLPLYLLGFFFALLEALRMVAAGALLADLLPREALARARGQLGALYTAADTLSDLAAGLLFTRNRPWTVGLGSGLLFLAAGLYRVLPLPPRPPDKPEGGSLLGLRFLWQSPTLRPILLREALLDLSYALFASLLPFVVLRGLGEAPWVLGLLGTAQSLGGVLGGASGGSGPGNTGGKGHPKALPGPRGPRPPGGRPASPLAPPGGVSLSPGGWGRPIQRGGWGGAPEPGSTRASGPGGRGLSLPERGPGPLRPPPGRGPGGSSPPPPLPPGRGAPPRPRPLVGKGVAVRGKPPSWASPAKAALWEERWVWRGSI